MINKPIKEIGINDINQLIENSVGEGKTIEYKRDLPGTNDSNKKEFLADVSAFANTLGGYIIYGIEEDKGFPSKIKGLEIKNIDKEILRLESMIRDGIEPRIQFEINIINTNDSKNIALVQVHKSWLSPHRVIFKGSNRFYARNSAGKYELDTYELKTAFNLTDTINKKIKDFRNNRVMKIISGETPILTPSEGKMILHLIPMESFSPGVQYSLDKFYSNSFKPMCATGWSGKINLEGHLSYSGGDSEKSYTYTQIYKNGIIEALDSHILDRSKAGDGGLYIPHVYLEREALNYTKKSLDLLKELGVNTPIVCYLSLIGTKGYTMSDSRGRIHNDYNKIIQDNLLLPEIIINNYDDNINKKLRPIFDLIWNACGLRQSINFDEDDNFIGE